MTQKQFQNWRAGGVSPLMPRDVGRRQNKETGSETTSQSSRLLLKRTVQTLMALAMVSASRLPAQDEPAHPAALLDKQLDVSLEARDIERILGKVKQASDLAKQRIGDAATSAESVSKSLEGREVKEARAKAAATSLMLREVAAQLEVMLKDNAPERVEATQRLVQELAELQRELAMNLGEAGKPESDAPMDPTKPGAGKPDKNKPPKDQKLGGGMTDEERKKELAERSERLAAKAQTIEDVLKGLSGSTDPADQEAIKAVAAILTETKLNDALAAIKQGGLAIQAGRLEDARLSGLDAADRLEMAAQRLDQAYRQLIAPRAEELRKAEEQLAELQRRMGELETPSSLAGWKRDVAQLLEQLERLGVDETDLAEVTRVIAAADVATNSAAGTWQIVNGRYAAPVPVARAVRDLQVNLQSRIQGLLLGDLRSDDDGAIPPRYVEFVDRYYDVLTRETKGSNRMEQNRP